MSRHPKAAGEGQQTEKNDGRVPGSEHFNGAAKIRKHTAPLNRFADLANARTGRDLRRWRAPLSANSQFACQTFHETQTLKRQSIARGRRIAPDGSSSGERGLGL